MEKTLVVLAAGMGSRFGGLKQIEPVGPSGEFIIDYSVYDALKAGFNKVVFVIRKEHYDIFKETIGKRIENKVKVEYAFQEIEDLVKTPLKRTKPFGTGHAIFATRKNVKGPFATITSDDYYGPNGFKMLSEFLDNEKGLAIVGYKIGTTLSDNGAVKRGVILTDNGKVTAIRESKVAFDGDKVLCEPLDGSKSFHVSPDTGAGMMIYGFNQDIYEILEKELDTFVKTADLENDEFILTDVIDSYINTGNVKLLTTDDKWIGMTYKEDLDYVKGELEKLIASGVYPRNLWGNDERKN